MPVNLVIRGSGQVRSRVHVKKPTGNGNSIAHTNNEGKGGVQVKEETGINHNTNKNTELIIIQIRIHIRSIHVCPELEEMVFLLPSPPVFV